MKIKVCKATGRLDINCMTQEEIEKLVKARVATEVTTGHELKYYVSPFKFPEVEQNPTLNRLFGRNYPGNWRHGPFNPTNYDMHCNKETAVEALRKWVNLMFPE